MVSQFYLPVAGGQERMIAELSRALRRRGHRVEIAATTPTMDLNGTQDAGHRIDTLVGRFSGLHSDGGRRHVPPFPDPGGVASLRRIIRDVEPDVIHAHDWMAFSLLGALPRPRPPVVWSLHDYSFTCVDKRLFLNDEVCAGPTLSRCLPCAREKYGRVAGAATALALPPARAALRAVVDTYLPVSETVAVRSGLRSRNLPYRVVPNFIQDEIGPGDHPQRPDGVPDGPYIAYAGDITRHKGVNVLVAAHAMMDGPPPLVLVGREFPDEAIGFPDGVVRLGRRSHDDVLAVMAHATVAAVPSVWAEPFGIVAIEALAMGVPVVASDVGGLADVVRGHECGAVVAPGDRHALATALRAITSDPGHRARLSEGALRRAEDFRGSRVVPEFERAYQDVVDIRRGPTALASPEWPNGDPWTTS